MNVNTHMVKGCKCYKEKHCIEGDYFICIECLPDDIYDLIQKALEEKRAKGENV